MQTTLHHIYLVYKSSLRTKSNLTAFSFTDTCLTSPTETTVLVTVDNIKSISQTWMTDGDFIEFDQIITKLL